MGQSSITATRTRLSAITAALLTSCFGCSDSTTDDVRLDATDSDSNIADTSDDTGAPDSGAPDSGAPDSGATDSGATDSGATDSDATDVGGDATVESGAADAKSDANGDVFDASGDARSDANIDTGVVCPAVTPPVLEAFGGTTLDAAKWVTALPSTASPTVTISSGRVELSNGGHLATSASFDPKIAPVRATGEWKVAAAGNNERFSVLTRSSGTPTSGTAETSAGIECAISVGPSVSASFVGRAASVTDVVASGSMSIASGDTITFDAYDDGDLVICTFRKRGTTQIAAVIGNSAFRPSTNKVTFHDAARANATNTASLDHVIVEQGIPQLPLHEWRFDEDFPPVAEALVGNVNGTYGGSILRAGGFFGIGATMPGNENGYVTFGNGAGKFGTKDFTVSFWFWAPSSTSTRELFGTRNTSGPGQWFSLRQTGAQIVFEVSQDTSGTNAASVTSATYAEDAYHHLAAVRRGTRLELWIDGVLSSTSAATAGVANVSGTGALQFGRTSFTTTDAARFLGSVDILRLYESALGRCEMPVLATKP